MKPPFSDTHFDDPKLGLAVVFPAPGIIEAIGAHWDWIWIDGQHGDMTATDIPPLIRACELIDRPAFVRVPSHEPGAISQALDAGAAGIIVPMVDSPPEAQALVKASKFPPLGNRSFGSIRQISLHTGDYATTANTDTMLLVQIETPEGLHAADAIAAVEGVDGLLLGPSDMLLRRGLKRDTPEGQSALQADMEHLMNVCRKHGKHSATVAATPERLHEAREMGFTMIVAACDALLLMEGSDRAHRATRGSQE